MNISSCHHIDALAYVCTRTRSRILSQDKVRRLRVAQGVEPLSQECKQDKEDGVVIYQKVRKPQRLLNRRRGRYSVKLRVQPEHAINCPAQTVLICYSR